MLPAPALRISALLCVLLATDMVVAFSGHVVSFPAGDTVTLSCSDKTKNPRNLSEISIIIWRKENGSHSLHFASDGKNSISNFTDRFSFLSAQLPPVLQIRDVRPDDAGNYTCKITIVRLGNIEKSWTLQISESSTALAHIYIYSSVAGGFVILVLIAGIIYCKFGSKHNTIPSQIYQSSPENDEKEEPVYDNANEDYFLRFNTLYDQIPSDRMVQRPDHPL